jgi:glycosyltransferase involved in cell wall biosynthesis
MEERRAGSGMVSIIIPTLNSERTVAKCLESIAAQSYKDREIIIVDSFSKDKTVEIAREFKCRVVRTRWKLLGARYIGFRKARGDFVLMLDSDQVLRGKEVLGKAVGLMKRYDMLLLEEGSYNVKTWLEKLADSDRRLVHRMSRVQLDPVVGTLLPRFFRREVLGSAFKRIDMERLHDVVIFDHVIIYYEAYKASKRVGVLGDAVWHMEPSSLSEVLSHNYRYGVTARELVRLGYYNDLIKRKARFRKGAISSGSMGLALQSYLLLLPKGTAYELGYLLG